MILSQMARNAMLNFNCEWLPAGSGIRTRSSNRLQRIVVNYASQ